MDDVPVPVVSWKLVRSPETTESVLVVSSNQPVAVEPIVTNWFPFAPFFLNRPVVVVERLKLLFQERDIFVRLKRLIFPL